MVAPLGRSGQVFPKGLQALHKAHLKWEQLCRNIDIFKSFFLFEWKLNELSLKTKLKQETENAFSLNWWTCSELLKGNIAN